MFDGGRGKGMTKNYFIAVTLEEMQILAASINTFRDFACDVPSTAEKVKELITTVNDRISEIA